MKRCKEIEILMGVNLDDPIDNKDCKKEKKQKPKKRLTPAPPVLQSLRSVVQKELERGVRIQGLDRLG